MRRNALRASAGEGGFTLVEVVLALAIIGIIVVPLTALFIANAGSGAEAYSYLRAAYLAQARIEEFRALPFSSVVSEPAAAVPDAPGYLRQVTVTEQRTTTEILLGLPARLKQVTVTVTWDGGRKNVSLSTLISGGQTP